MKILTLAINFRTVKNDPFGFIVDTLIKIVVNLIIPIPLAGEVIVKFRGPVLAFLAFIVILGISLLLILATVFISVFVTPSGFFQQFASSFTQSPLATSNEGFEQSSVPSQNPFGGSGMVYTSITAGFMDPAYFLQFGKNHNGIDLVPSEAYYENSKTFQQNNKIVIFATHTGNATVYSDQNGGETVEVMNNENSLKTVYIHFKKIYVKSADTIQAGTPLGEMGKTGFATGEHLHYEIRIKDDNNWRPVNPLTYIK